MYMISAELSSRQATIFRLLAWGLTATDIAILLGLSYSTIRVHIHRVGVKLGTKTLAETIAIVILHNLLDNKASSSLAPRRLNYPASTEASYPTALEASYAATHSLNCAKPHNLNEAATSTEHPVDSSRR